VQLGQFGCHGLDELLISELRVENLEVPAGMREPISVYMEITWEDGSLCCLVLAQTGE
jgi:hypothetical protein